MLHWGLKAADTPEHRQCIKKRHTKLLILFGEFRDPSMATSSKTLIAIYIIIKIVFKLIQYHEIQY